MKKLLVLSCLIIASINANYVVINNSGRYLLFTENSLNAIVSVYLLAPGDTREIDTTRDLPFILSSTFFLSRNLDVETFNKAKGTPSRMPLNLIQSLDSPGRIEFKTPDEKYREILQKAKEVLPIITITNDDPTGFPLINAPQTTEDLLAQLKQIREEKLKSLTREVHKSTGLPNEEGRISGEIAGYAIPTVPEK